MSEASYSDEQALNLLNQLEFILEFDPLLDEVGYVHPSQFSTLNESASGSDCGAQEYDSTVFWNRDHKLGISTRALLPLYKASKKSFMGAVRKYKMCEDISTENKSILECDMMKHSKGLLLLSSDFGTAWNYRKLLVSKKQQLPLLMDELLLSALVLSYSPKSDHAWSHRRWVIKMIAGKCSNMQDIITKESELVKKIAERFKMNYRAWNHRCWLVPFMSGELVLQELKESRNWVALHVADNCGFHYCRRLLLKLFEDFWHKQDPQGTLKADAEIHTLWKEELDWNETLIKRYIGRESLWLHRRFLSLHWIKHFVNDLHSVSTSENMSKFMDNELQLLIPCFTIPNNEFEDVQAQALYAATYFLWLSKIIPESNRDVLHEKLKSVDLKTLLNKVCPEKTIIWDILMELPGNNSPSSEVK